jgi:hypothetical protein
MNTPGISKVISVLAVMALAALWPGKAAIARGFRGPTAHAPAMHLSRGSDRRLRGGDRFGDYDRFGDHDWLGDHGRFGDRAAPFFHDSARWFLPLGAVVPFLPDFYSTYWFGGTPYYYADGNYYVWRPYDDGYVVTMPPANEEPAMTPPDSTSSLNVFAYPLKGQTQARQARDHSECRDWAVGQAGGDPTKATATDKDANSAAVREGYVRALSACLVGRGYSVK